MSVVKQKLKALSENTNLMFFISIVCMFLTSTIMGLGDWDFVWQSHLGKAVVERGDFFGLKDLIWGTVNVNPYYDHEWLTNVFFYLVTVLFGEVYSIIVVKVFIELLLGVTVYFFVKQVIKTYVHISFITYVSCMFLTYCFGALLVKPKAYDISLALVMWLLILLEKRKENTISFKCFAICILILTVFWNNIHSGSIVLLVAITGLYWLVFWRDKNTVILGIVDLLALGLNPYGYKLIYFDIIHNSDVVMKTIIRDWHCLDLKMAAGKAICLLILLILIHLLHMKIDRNNIVFVVLFLVFLVMTISSMRHFLYMYPIGLVIICKGQFENFKKLNIKTFGIPTYFISIFTVVLLILFGVNFKNVQPEYTMSYITPKLDTILSRTTKITNDGLFTGDVNVWSSGYKSFQSGAFPHTRERTIDSYILLTGSEKQIQDIIKFYSLDKFLFFKTEKSDTGYTLNTNLYDYMISRPNEYVLLYDADVLVYFVSKEVENATK